MTRWLLLNLAVALGLSGCSSENGDSRGGTRGADRPAPVRPVDAGRAAPAPDAGGATAAATPDATPDSLPSAAPSSLSPGRLTAGQGFTCFTSAGEGRVACWGAHPCENDEAAESRRRPAYLVGLPAGIVEVAASLELGCARSASGSVHCWGSPAPGAGAEGSSAPWVVADLPPARSFDVSESRACAVTQEGALYCWTAASDDEGQPAAGVEGLLEVRQVALGEEHLCALRTDGHVYCSGENEYGQLGDASRDPRESPVQVVGLSNAVDLAAGSASTCAVRLSGRITCWGMNDQGQLGEGTETSARFAPAEVLGLGRARQVEVGDSHACAIYEGGQVRCWGENTYGQLGDGSTSVRREPVAVLGLPAPAAALALGPTHSCALLQDERVFCWGDGARGELGGAVRRSSYEPTEVPGVSGRELHAAGESTCTLVADAAPRCWGHPNPRPDDGFRGAMPAQLDERVEPGQIRRVWRWSFGSCVLRRDGALRCEPRLVGGAPVELTEIADVRGSNFVACVRSRAGEISCWRWSRSERGARVASSQTPTQIEGLTGVIDLALGANHACALLRNGSVRCWGDNQQGQLGDGTTENSTEPVPVRGVAQAVELAAMANRSCARLRNGRVTCWGDGEGQGSAAADLGVEDVLQLAAGLGHLCLLVESDDEERSAPPPRSGGAASDAGAVSDGGDTVSDAGGDASAEPDAPTGRVVCLGENDRGQLARSPETLEESDTPQAIVGLGGVVAITAGSMHSCAQRADGHVFCWGDDMSGQLGRIPSWIRPTPVEVRLPASE